MGATYTAESLQPSQHPASLGAFGKEQRENPWTLWHTEEGMGVRVARWPGCNCLGQRGALPCPLHRLELPRSLQSRGHWQGFNPPATYPLAWPSRGKGPWGLQAGQGQHSQLSAEACRHTGWQVGGQEEVWSPLGAICLWYQASKAAGWLTGIATGCCEGAAALKSH